MGWYGQAYLVLLLMVPFVNGGVEYIYEHCGRKGLVLAEAGLLAWMFLSWLNLDLRWIGVWQSHSPRQLLVLYIVGRTVRKWELGDVSRRFLLVGFVLIEFVVLAWSSLGHVLNSELLLSIKMWEYHSPFMVVCAVVVFHLFKGLDIPKSAKKVACMLAPSMFGVYLLHHGTCGEVFRPFYTALEISLSELLGDNAIMRVLVCALTAVAVFSICVAIDFVRRGLLWSIKWTASK